MEMKNKFLILIFTFLLQTKVSAEWIRIGLIEENIFYYSDNISFNGDNPITWMMVSSSKNKEVIEGAIDGKKIKSAQIKREINCSQRKFKALSFAYYGETMGKNLISRNDEEEDWEHILPGTINEEIVIQICKKTRLRKRF